MSVAVFVVAGAALTYAGEEFDIPVLSYLGMYVGGVAGWAIGHTLHNNWGSEPSTPAIEMQTRSQLIRSAVTSRKIIYGEAVVSGPLVYAGSSGSLNEWAHIVVPLAGHEVEGIDDVWFNDTLSSETSGTYDTPLGVLLSFLLFTDDYGNPGATSYELRIDDVTYEDTTVAGLVALLPTTTYSASQPFGGPHVQITANTISDTFTVNYARTHTATYYEAAGQVVSQTYSTFSITKHLGGVGQVADPDLVDAVEEWTVNHIGNGVAYLYIKLQYDRNAYPYGLPNIKAKVRGKKLYDPRDTTTAYSKNWALCIRDYIVSGVGADSTEIDETFCNAAANICDEDVEIAGGTQKRYTANGVIDTANIPAQNMEELLKSGGGACPYVQGKYRIFAGAYNPPDGRLSESNLRGPLRVRPRTPKADLFNGVRGTFTSPDNDYQPTDFPIYKNPTYKAQDGDEELLIDMAMPYVDNELRAQRLAKMHLERARQGIVVDFPANWSALNVSNGDVKGLDISLLGWSSVSILKEDGFKLLKEDGFDLLTDHGAKDFRIIDWKLTPGGIDLVLKEESEQAYEWLDGYATEIDPNPDTSFISSGTIEPPTSLVANSGSGYLNVLPDGTITSRIHVTWVKPSAFVTGYEINYTDNTRDTFSSVKTLDNFFNIEPATDQATYFIQVRAYNSFVPSDWVDIQHLCIGKSDPPPDVDNFLVERLSDGTRRYTWTYSNKPADHAGYKIRYKSGTGGTWSTMTDLHDDLLSSSPYESNALAAGTYTFGIKAVDTSGIESLNAKIIELTIGDPRLANAIAFESPSAEQWPGILTNCWRDPYVNILYATDTKDWSDFATDVVPWSGWTTWARSPNTSFIYEHLPIDVGIITDVVILVSPIYDGDSITIEEAHSDTGSGYSSWAAVTTGVVTSRYFKIRGTVAKATGLSSLTAFPIILTGETESEEINDLDTSTLAACTPSPSCSTSGFSIAAGDFRAPIVKTYSVIKMVNVTLQNVGSAWSWELIDKDVNVGPRIKIYDNSTPPVLADATIDIEIKGIV